MTPVKIRPLMMVRFMVSPVARQEAAACFGSAGREGWMRDWGFSASIFGDLWGFDGEVYRLCSIGRRAAVLTIGGNKEKKLMRKVLWCVAAAVVVGGAFWMGRKSVADETAKNRYFELRTYSANEGKLDALHARFRDHTMKLFEKHGMTNISYWTPMDKDKGAENTLIYLLAHKSKPAAE